MKSLFTETVYPLQVLLCKRMITKEHTITHCFNNSHGISLTNYHNHYIMAFDLTSTQEGSHDFILPELTNCTISVN